MLHDQKQDWRERLRAAHPFASPEMEKFIEDLLVEEKLGQLEEVLMRLPNSITPNKEPPKNKLSQNQIFGAGQMNMALRTKEMLQSLKTKINL